MKIRISTASSTFNVSQFFLYICYWKLILWKNVTFPRFFCIEQIIILLQYILLKTMYKTYSFYLVVLWFLLTLSAFFYAFYPITMERLNVHIPNNTTMILNGVGCYYPKTLYVNFYLFFIKLPMFRSIIRIKLCHYCILQLHQYNCTPKPPEPRNRYQFPMLKYNSDVCILCCN